MSDAVNTTTTTAQQPVTQSASQVDNTQADDNIKPLSKIKDTKTQATGNSDQDTKNKPEPKKYSFGKVKINGKELELNDLSEEDVIRHFQRSYGSGQTYAETKKMREEAERMYQEVQSAKSNQEKIKQQILENPIQYLISQGLDPKKLRSVTESYLYDELQRDEMSEEQKQLIEAQQKLAAIEKEREDEKKRSEEQRLKEMSKNYLKELIPKLQQARESVGLASTAANIQRMAAILGQAAKTGNNIDPERAARIVKEENQAFVYSTLKAQSDAVLEAVKSRNQQAILSAGKELESFLSPEIFNAIQHYGVAKYRAGMPDMPGRTTQQAPQLTFNQPGKATALTEDEYLKQRAERLALAQQEWDLKHSK